MNPIGIMQGRLSPPSGGRIQSFPVDTWRDEFPLASKAGLACIEWIYETGTEAANPLGTNSGVADIRRESERSGVAVWSICADYYMAERLVASDGSARQPIVEHLLWLIERSSLLEIRYIVLPFVDSSSLQSPEETAGLVSMLASVAPAAADARLELHLETDLDPRLLADLLDQISDPCVRANYDSGNSAALGHDPVAELDALGPWLGSVHIKDRLRNGGTVSLGTGAADLSTSCRLIRGAGFRGPLILQVARDEALSEVELAMRNRRLVEGHLAMEA